MVASWLPKSQFPESWDQIFFLSSSPKLHTPYHPHTIPIPSPYQNVFPKPTHTTPYHPKTSPYQIHTTPIPSTGILICAMFCHGFFDARQFSESPICFCTVLFFLTQCYQWTLTRSAKTLWWHWHSRILGWGKSSKMTAMILWTESIPMSMFIQNIHLGLPSLDSYGPCVWYLIFGWGIISSSKLNKPINAHTFQKIIETSLFW